MVSIKEEIPSCSTLEDTCTVYVQGEDIKMENTQTKSKIHNYSLWWRGLKLFFNEILIEIFIKYLCLF